MYSATRDSTRPRTSGRSNGARYQQAQPSNGGGLARSSDFRNLRNPKECLPLASRVLQNIIAENDTDQLVVSLTMKPGWKPLLESDFQLRELRVIFRALRKCCESINLELLRRFMSSTLGVSKFETRCCLLLPAIGSDDLTLAEDVISVLETSASLQPAGLARPAMIILCSLEGNRAMASWNETSGLDLLAKIRSTREQITIAAKTNSAARTVSNSPKIYKGYRTSGPAPKNFREMSVLPTRDDLEEEHPFLRPNIVRGAYQSVDDYLDVQFRLLREDYVTPLRDGLREFKGLGAEFCYSKLRGIQDVRFYMGVRYQRPQEMNQSLVSKERITLILDQGDFKRVNWSRSKRFTNGALIGISKDKFESIIFATVTNRDPEALQRYGLLTLELCLDEELLEFKPEIEFSLIESSGAYFEAYRHNLAVIQTMTELPFSRNLVFAEKDVRPPSYRSFMPRLKLDHILKIQRPDLDFSLRWPQLEDTILNERQFEAVKSAFRNELCVIQGPPGTGKTFVGLKIVELMLLNNVTEKPFLIVCYTNHALDQFVEGISKFSTSIVRLGGRCSSEELDRFTLRNLRRGNRDQQRRDGEYTRINLERLMWKLRNDRSFLNERIKLIEILLARLQGRAIFKECRTLGSRLEDKLGLDNIHKLVTTDEPEVNEDELEDDGNLSDEDRGEVEEEEVIPVQTSCSTRQEQAISKLLGSHKHDPFGQFAQLAYTKYKFERRRHYIEAMRESQAEADGRFDVPPMMDLTTLEWWQLYRDAHWEEAFKEAQKYISECGREDDALIHVSADELNRLRQPPVDDIDLTIRCLSSRLLDVRRRLLQNMKESSEAEQMLDFEIIKSCKIIGVTTTGAAKFNALLRKVEYEIVVVEEAAEVLEAHLITTLCPSTKQLILIGDHQQLQPSTTVYKLATNFNLQISLFERLINNGITYVRLQEQHRMRDQFLKLLVPTIYSDYFSHKSVLEYENIRGLSHNLFFITHEQSEESERENSSKSNLYEANFVAYLALYFLMQGYSSSQIVILTTYSGQVFAIRGVIRDIEHRRQWTGMKTIIDRQGKKCREPVKPDLPVSMFEGVRITTVDNYQGEESDIVIASFVRSNDDQRIGFLSKDNRVCVALSRAKKGFYCIGNIAMLAKASKTWEDISRVLLDQNCVNKGLELFCEIHDVRLLASTPEHFLKFSDGGCPEPCGLRLNCGHVCPKTCHRLDADHAQFVCVRDCERPRPCGHPCHRRCHENCGRCSKRVVKKLGCGHDANDECWKKPESITCNIRVVKSLLLCAHTAELPCSFPIEKHQCQELCGRLMPCQVHRCDKKCSAKCGKCMEFVDARSPCGHDVRLQCRDSKDETSLRNACDTKVEVQLPCGHSNMVACQDQHSALSLSDRCMRLTEVTCSSKHSLKVTCPVARSGQVDDHCKTQTSVTLKCGHQIMRPCNQTRGLDIAQLATKCNELVKVTASCGHELEVTCKTKTVFSSTVLRTKCEALIEETLKCGHKRTRKCNDNKECEEPVTVKSSCGHEVLTLCSKSKDDEFSRLRCTTKCVKMMECGHQCTGKCCSSSGEEFHQKCGKKCGKTLFCGHACFSNCHSQCNPCREKEKLSCPHGVRLTECLLSINEPCTKKPQHCPHVRCEATNCTDCHCSCDSRCQRTPNCQTGSNRRKKSGGPNHRCVGLCFELCVCSVCDERAIRNATIPRGVNRKEARYVKLPCYHIFEVSWLDDYMRQHKDFLSFPKCPVQRCSAQIRLVRRYHKLLERIRLNMREVYEQVFGNLMEMSGSHQEFFEKCRTEAESHREGLDPERGNGEITGLVDKALGLSKTPSRFVLDYLRSLSRMFAVNLPGINRLDHRRSELIASEELQLQLLSDYINAVNKQRKAHGLPQRTLLRTPIPADGWAACEQDHVFQAGVEKKCPICTADGDGLAPFLARIDL